ncbi:hypothetical protein KAX97_09965 [candidate division WOR-3 bacterium]|nr:hypothetical protein [candidate division WOR-3 bacterium]
MKKTSIQISEDMWRKLQAMKEVGDTFDDVIDRIIRRNQIQFPTWFRSEIEQIREYLSSLTRIAKVP